MQGKADPDTERWCSKCFHRASRHFVSYTGAIGCQSCGHCYTTKEMPRFATLKTLRRNGINV